MPPKRKAAASTVAEPPPKTENGGDDDDQTEAEVKEPARRRGRPKSVKPAKENQPAAGDEAPLEEAKRRPGRPRRKAAEDAKSLRRQAEREAEEEDDDEDEEAPPPPKKRGRPKKAVKPAERAPAEKDAEDDNDRVDQDEEEEEEVEKAPKRRGRPPKAKKAEAAKPAEEPKVEKKLLNAASTDWSTVSIKSDKKNGRDQPPAVTITSWNIDGIRAWIKKGGLEILERAQPDILVLQETKCAEEKLPEEVKKLEGYRTYWCASDKEGYAGVGLLSKAMPIEVTYGIKDEDQDKEGRCITAEYEKYYVVGVYVPNAGRGLVTLDKRLEWNKSFKAYISELNGKKPVIVCGDMNVAHNEIDLKNPKSNKKNAGFTQEERDGMTDFLAAGYVDVFRKLNPDAEDKYTFWSYITKARAKNIGWRLDYFIVPEAFMENVCDIQIHDQVLGSDHCPLSLFMEI